MSSNKDKPIEASLGIIAEYNPFHKGHMYHLEQSLMKSKAGVSVAAISGNFTQRGEIAILDKWDRAEMAVKNGINLVVEIPTLFACNHAGYFAKAGVEILENLGVSFISFGSESGNLEELTAISCIIDKEEKQIEKLISEDLKKGFSYPRSRQEAINKILREDVSQSLKNPNNLLAIEYLRNIKKAKPLTVERIGAGYHDFNLDGEIVSAKAIRMLLEEKLPCRGFLTEASWKTLSKDKGSVHDSEKVFHLLRQRILYMTKEELNHIFGGEEGLGNKLKKEIRLMKSYEDMITSLKSKRYTRTRISRYLAHILLNIKREDVLSAKNYIRVLAFDKKGRQYLKAVKKNELSKLPILTNINREIKSCSEIEKTLEKDILAADIYNEIVERDLYENSDFVKKPIHL